MNTIPANDLELVSFEDQGGALWETGVPIVFEFAHNTEKSPYVGATYGQDIEPAGFYMLAREGDYETPGWEYGETTFDSPLVLEHGGYGPDGWKARLSEAYGGRKGRWLSKAILKSGHDGIVTISMREDEPVDVSEIVDLRVVR